MSVERILVLNLTRFGDLLQTSPTIAALAELHPGARITVAAERNFAAVCEGIPGIDRLYRVDLDRLGTLVLEGGERLLDAHRFVRDVVDELRAMRFDVALNFSSSRMSAVLMGLLGIPDVRGWTMTSDGFRAIRHPWARLFAANCLNRRLAPFNLVDSYRSMADAPTGPDRLLYAVPDAARTFASELLASGGARAGERLVALQLGASRDTRRWPTASFAALARVLQEAGLQVVLVGGSSERALALEVARDLARPPIDACGRTDIPGLGAVLERVDLLVTGDTGPMHMAAAVGTPVVALFFGPALPFDTGPYGRDHVMLHAAAPCAPCDHSVTCLNPFCRDWLTPELVARAALARLGGDWDDLARAARAAAPVRIYRGRFDASGYHLCEDVAGGAPSASDVLRWAYRATWLACLRGAALPEPFPAGIDTGPFAAFVELALVGLETCSRMRGALARDDVAALASLGEELEGVDRRIARVGTVHPDAAPIAQVFQFGKENLEDDAVAGLLARTEELYRDLARTAATLRALLGGAAEGKARGNAALR
ncbi:MAG TPA: glycosyltransferase family 9 protein [Candidatus Binatia bacterium]|nr:glycosyltransferase family 9 protein [Candidatus Binatia bacterium]